MCSWVSNGLTFCVSFLVLCWFLLGPFDKFDEQVGAQHVFFPGGGGEVDVLLIWNIFQRFCIDDNYTSLLGDSKGWRGCCLELAASVRTRQKRARVNMDTFEIGQKLQGEVHLGWCWGAGSRWDMMRRRFDQASIGPCKAWLQILSFWTWFFEVQRPECIFWDDSILSNSDPPVTRQHYYLSIGFYYI